MMIWLHEFLDVLLDTASDVAPLLLVIVFFQVAIIRRPFPRLKDLVIGMGYVILGMSFFLLGLDKALFPLGTVMAEQLTHPDFIQQSATEPLQVVWQNYYWVYVFGASLGFATTFAEPALIAVALKAQQISGGTIKASFLRLAVSLGVSFGIALGTYRIVTGTELYLYIIIGYVIVIIQTAFAPKSIIGLAFDSGGVTTSCVTVPLVTALGIGLASTIPGRNPLLDGFGLIAFASLFPIMAVLFYSQLADRLGRRNPSKAPEKGD